MTWSHLFNNVFTLIGFLVVIMFPVFITGFYFTNKRKFEEDTWCDEFEAKYGLSYGHLKTKVLPSNVVVFLHSFFVIRRFIFAVAIVLLEHRPGL